MADFKEPVNPYRENIEEGESQVSEEVIGEREEEKQIEKEVDLTSEELGAEELKEIQPLVLDEEDEETTTQKEADKMREEKVEGRRLENLMMIAQDKGAGFAIKVAQKMNDACLLDLLHDKLIEKNAKK